MLEHLPLPAALAVVLAACGGGESGTAVVFDLDSATDTPATFWDAPFPSDLRVGADGRPSLVGYPNPRSTPIVTKLLAIAADRRGWPTMPVAYFQFDGELAPHQLDDLVAADASSPFLIVDIDPDSPQRGELVPAVAKTLAIEDWSPEPMLAVAPLPGVSLRGDTTYAVVVKREAGDAGGKPLARSSVIKKLMAGESPGGARGDDAAAMFAPLLETLDQLGVDRDEVAAATVFTTGDPVADMAAMSDAVLARDSVTIAGLALDPDDGATHERYCELHGTVEMPQFQQGTPPFNSEGLFEIGGDGLPIEQRTETAQVVIAIPKGPMPAAGYPLMLYFHGSGGRAATVVDAGPTLVAGGDPEPGLGPAHVVAEHGIASAGASLPLSPDRLPGASDIAYLNFNNLPAFRDTFRQGILEQRLFLRALLELRIDPTALAGCDGPSLPNGETEFFFDPDSVVASGQSMGGMYTNLITPLEPIIGAAVPTGAGGLWNKMILETDLVDGAADFAATAVGTRTDFNSYVHPGMHVLFLAWEPVEPMVFMPRLARRPLPGYPARPTYEPVGKDDIYFPTTIFDAAAVAYGHQQAGNQEWPEMQVSLDLVDRGGLADYPITDNLESENGDSYTGVVVQYPADGIRNGHFIYAQLDEVKYQYGCFLATFLANGVATVPAPAALGTPCP